MGMSTGSGTARVLRAQRPLFDDGWEIDLPSVRAARESLMQRAKAPNTLRAYAHSWKVFARWCELAGLRALPAKPETLGLFITWAVKHRKPRPYSIANVQHIVAAVKAQHRSADLPLPWDDSVRSTLSGAVRSTGGRGRKRRGKKPLSHQQLSMMVTLLGKTAREVRDKAILTLGFASSWRRCELSALTTDDVEFVPKGMIVQLGRSKTDQQGVGREIRIPYAKKAPELCAVTALQEWLEIRGSWSGPLFTPFYPSGRMKPKACAPKLVATVVKKTMARAGWDAKHYAAHSLRSGMITTASEAKAHPFAIAERSGHRDMNTLFDYVRSSQGFENDPLAAAI